MQAKTSQTSENNEIDETNKTSETGGTGQGCKKKERRPTMRSFTILREGGLARTKKTSSYFGKVGGQDL